jgi:hypothetical protein
MLTYLFIQVLCLVVLTEALTELVVKSEIFKPFRNYMSKSAWFKELIHCGYCFSVWVAFWVVLLTQTTYPLVPSTVPGSHWLDICLMTLVVHRASNVLHNVIDKWTDKYYDVRYVNSDKSE